MGEFLEDRSHTGAIEQAVVRALLKGHTCARQRLHDRLGLRIGPIEHGNVRERKAGTPLSSCPTGVQRVQRGTAEKLVDGARDE
jgi:hypothetical protein